MRRRMPTMNSPIKADKAISPKSDSVGIERGPTGIAPPLTVTVRVRVLLVGS